MGRPKKPIEKLKENGTYRPSVHGEKTLKAAPPKGTPRPPERLNRYAKEEFRRIVRELEASGMLAAIDLGALSLLCDQYGLALEIDLYIRKEFKTWTAYLNTVNYQNDLHHKAYNKALEYYFKNLGLFGITPAERAKIQVSGENSPEKKRINSFAPV